MERKKRLIFPHQTQEWMKLSVRIFAAITMSMDYIKDVFIPWLEDGCLDLCEYLESNDNNEEYLIEIYNSLETIFELIVKSMELSKNNKEE